ncbi:hypothetical protein PSENEW3_00003175 [Picochlorum sp. SENEW3]|nr:hypothetical protein PSENEW3_00003175 [Picochlorum sp. SENEW3]
MMANLEDSAAKDKEWPSLPIPATAGIKKRLTIEKITPMAFLPTFFHPRRVTFLDEETQGHYKYGSRPHRKHRYMRFIPQQVTGAEIVVPPVPKIFLLDVKNISWWIAIIFCLGTACWVFAGHIFMWPFPSETASKYTIGYVEVAGILLFDFGCYLLLLEALNEDVDICCGAEVREVGKKHDEEIPSESALKEDEEWHLCDDVLKQGVLCRRRKKEYVNLYANSEEHFIKQKARKLYVYVPEEDGKNAADVTGPKSDHECRAWRWWGWDFHNVGFTAAFLLGFGCLIFSIAVFTAIPGVVADDQWQVQQALIWAPQTIGSVCFVLSGLLYTLEEQDVWYKPGFTRIGWYASFANLIGGIGFLMSSIFGYLANWKGNGEVCCQHWGTAFNAFYGNWAFMVGSLILLLEVENKDPASPHEYILSALAWLRTRELPGRKKEKEKESNNTVE